MRQQEKENLDTIEEVPLHLKAIKNINIKKPIEHPLVHRHGPLPLEMKLELENLPYKEKALGYEVAEALEDILKEVVRGNENFTLSSLNEFHGLFETKMGERIHNFCI